MKIFFKILHEKQGGHYHCSVFSSKRSDGTFAKLGTLCLDENDFDALQSNDFEIILQAKQNRFSNDSGAFAICVESLEANSKAESPAFAVNPLIRKRNLTEDFEFSDKHSE